MYILVYTIEQYYIYCIGLKTKLIVQLIQQRRYFTPIYPLIGFALMLACCYYFFQFFLETKHTFHLHCTQISIRALYVHLAYLFTNEYKRKWNRKITAFFALNNRNNTPSLLVLPCLPQQFSNCSLRSCMESDMRRYGFAYKMRL